MAERWVVNASPIIVLAKVGHAHLLSALVNEIVVPQIVVDEIIQSAAEMIRQLQNHDYRIQDEIVRDALAQTVGEEW